LISKSALKGTVFLVALTSVRRRSPGLAGFGNVHKAKNREKNREFLDSDLKIVEFCPKSVNFVQKQGINREFCGYLPKLLSTRWLVLILVGFKKLTGN
jgi:hypothetical protein